MRRTPTVHKNTVKYRISKINEALGYDMTNAAEAYESLFGDDLISLGHE